MTGFLYEMRLDYKLEIKPKCLIKAQCIMYLYPELV